MKALIFGPSGAGKTYISTELKKQGINAMDADKIDGLSSWFDGDGNKVICPDDAGEEFLNSHSFLWDKEFLRTYLDTEKEIYLFGASGNVFEMLDLFDKVYFLKIEPATQKERLIHPSRENPMGNTAYQRERAVKWGMELEAQAKTLGIPFIDASLNPLAIAQILLSN